MQEIDLSYFFQTKSQATDFTRCLAGISEKIYQTNFNLEKVLLDQFGVKKNDKFMALLRENKIYIKLNSVLKSFLMKMQEQIAALPVLSLTLAFEPKEQTLKM